MQSYRVHRAPGAVELTGRVAGTAWRVAAVGRVGLMPWQDRPAPSTTFRALYDDAALYVQFHCADAAVAAGATELNGPVWLDSCVEWFFSPHGRGGGAYFNFEVNCCGTFLLGYGDGRSGRRLIDPAPASGIAVAASVPGPTRAPTMGRCRWSVAARMPLEVLAALAGRRVRPMAGHAWYGNVYRCGGPTDPYACWSPIDAPDPDFHRPGCFGRFDFA